MNKRYWTYYDWLEEHFYDFLQNIGIMPKWWINIIKTHGNEGYQYKDFWDKANIPFPHAMALYLLTYIPPYTNEDFADSYIWVINNYPKFKNLLTIDDLEKIEY